MIADHARLLEQHGIDYNNAIERFAGNMDLYERLASRYLDDIHFANAVAAFEQNDAHTTYQEVHALKGVAGNLSFLTLYQASSTLSDALQGGDMDTARMIFPAVREAHEGVIDALSQLMRTS